MQEEQLSLDIEDVLDETPQEESVVEEAPKGRRRKSKKGRVGEQQDMSEILQKIVDVEYSEIMSKNYIDYSMSVITDRALPDVRDGLKPVQRRILYDMHDIGISSDKPHRKVAKVVGDTMSKFHAHG